MLAQAVSRRETRECAQRGKNERELQAVLALHRDPKLEGIAASGNIHLLWQVRHSPYNEIMLTHNLNHA